jgi:hypothetical protein
LLERNELGRRAEMSIRRAFCDPAITNQASGKLRQQRS